MSEGGSKGKKKEEITTRKKKHKRKSKTGGENFEYDFEYVELEMPVGHTGDYF